MCRARNRMVGILILPPKARSQHEEDQKREIVLAELNGLSLRDEDLVPATQLDADYQEPQKRGTKEC
jgi:hypothetical protein